MRCILDAIKKKATYIPLEKFSEVFGELWNTLRCEFLKLETLQYYDVAEDPNYFAYINKDIEGFVTALKQFHDDEMTASEQFEIPIEFKRIHLISRPFSQYIEYEFYSYLISEKSGENIRCIDSIKNISEEYDDFIMFDGKAILINDFSNDGKWHGSWCYESSSNDDLLVNLRKHYLELFSGAKDYKNFAKFDNDIIKRMNGFLKP